jgi:hypothetical protein
VGFQGWRVRERILCEGLEDEFRTIAMINDNTTTFMKVWINDVTLGINCFCVSSEKRKL